MIFPVRPPARRLTALLATVVLALTAGGCGDGTGNGSATDEVTSITALDYYTDEVEHAQWSERLSQCGRAVGVKVEHSSVPGRSLVPTVLRQALSRTLPDVLMLDNPDLQQIVQTGALTPLDQYGIDSSGFAEGILSAGTYEGKVYGLAPTVSTVALVYNKDMLAEAGVAVPRTGEQLREAAAKLTRPGRYGMAVDANATFEGSWQLLPFLWSNGGASGVWTPRRPRKPSSSGSTWSRADRCRGRC